MEERCGPLLAGKIAVVVAARRRDRLDQVRVNALAPSFVPTAMNGYGGMSPIDDCRVAIDESSPIAAAFLEETALDRIVTVDDCADVALFLASDLSRSITGTIIPVDGGNHLARLPGFGPRRRRQRD